MVKAKASGAARGVKAKGKAQSASDGVSVVGFGAGLFGGPFIARPRKLDPHALGLTGRPLEIAKIIAEETERERSAEYARLPPISDEERERARSRPVLLGARTAEEVRMEASNSVPWDTLLRRGEVCTRCADRARIGVVELLDFAMTKCQPENWEAIFWYMQWAKECLAGNLPRDLVHEILAAKNAEVEQSRKAVAAKGGAAKAAKYEKAIDWVVSEWQRDARRWDSKKLFAEAHVVQVLEKFEISVKESTITDVWLSPSRLAKQIGK